MCCLSFGHWQRFNPHNLKIKTTLKKEELRRIFYHDSQTFVVKGFSSTVRPIHILPKKAAVPMDLHIVIPRSKVDTSYNLHIQLGLNQSENYNWK